MSEFGGLVVATLTPMHEDGSIDWESLGAHVQDLLEGGAEGLFVAGTTGEGLLLEEDERAAVVGRTVELAAGRVPVVGLCGGLATGRAIRLAALTERFPPIAGYKAVLHRRGVIASAAVRRPLRPLTREETATLEAGLKDLGL